MRRQIALLILAFAVFTFSAQGRENPDLGPMAVKDIHNHIPILLEGSGLGAPESIKSYISDEDGDEDDEDDLDALEVLSYFKRRR